MRIYALGPCRARFKEWDSKMRLFIQALLREILSSFGCYVSQILRTSLDSKLGFLMAMLSKPINYRWFNLK